MEINPEYKKLDDLDAILKLALNIFESAKAFAIATAITMLKNYFLKKLDKIKHEIKHIQHSDLEKQALRTEIESPQNEN